MTLQETLIAEKWAHAECWEGEDYVVTVRGATENPVGSCYTRRDAQAIAAFLSGHKDIILGGIIQRIRDEERSMMSKLLDDKYELAKNKPMPTVIPSASPSRSHYKERHQGFLSGLLVAKEIITSPDLISEITK